MVEEVADMVPGGVLLLGLVHKWFLVQCSLSLAHTCRKKKKKKLLPFSSCKDIHFIMRDSPS